MNAPVGEASLRSIPDSEVFRIHERQPSWAKRGIDVLVCLFAAPFALVVGLPIAILLKLDGGRVLYSQPRVGAGGRVFPCLKFRSMVRDADEQLQRMLESDPLARDEWQRYQKLTDDPRVTWFGSFLRAYSFDEIPQLINVARGEMSLVGPRPIMVDQVDLYGEQFAAYCAMKPGITGPWQVSGRNECTFAERVKIDSQYAGTWSIAGDLKIMLKTLPVVLARRGAK